MPSGNPQVGAGSAWTAWPWGRQQMPGPGLQYANSHRCARGKSVHNAMP